MYLYINTYVIFVINICKCSIKFRILDNFCKLVLYKLQTNPCDEVEVKVSNNMHHFHSENKHS